MRGLLLLALVSACKGSDRHEAPPPATPRDAPAANTQDAPPSPLAEPCFAIPLDADAEKAGIRRLAHRIPPAGAAAPRPRDVVVLPIGTRAPVPGLRRAGEEPLNAFGLGADALAAMAKDDSKQVTTVAPAHLEGAVIRLRGATSVLVAVGDAGASTLTRYRDDYAKRRIAASGGKVTAVEPFALIYDDVDSDGALDLVSFSQTKPSEREPTTLELGVLFSSGGIGFGRICCATSVRDLFVVPPTLSGGKTMIFDLAGDRLLVGDRRVEMLAVPSVGEDRGDMCLQTSATNSAELVRRP